MVCKNCLFIYMQCLVSVRSYAKPFFEDDAEMLYVFIAAVITNGFNGWMIVQQQLGCQQQPLLTYQFMNTGAVTLLKTTHKVTAVCLIAGCQYSNTISVCRVAHNLFSYCPQYSFFLPAYLDGMLVLFFHGM